MTRTRGGEWLVLVALLLVAGCGGDEGPKLVSAGGTVKLDGAPLAGATVTLVYTTGNTSSGLTDDQGKFTLTTGGRAGALVGKATVLVTKVSSSLTGSDPNTPMKPEDMMKMGEKMMQGGGTPPPPKSEIPEKYSQQANSGLSADIPAEGAKDLVFELQK